MKLLVIITSVNKSCTLMLNTGDIIHEYYQLEICLLIIILHKKNSSSCLRFLLTN